MIKSFKSKALAELWEKGRTAKIDGRCTRGSFVVGSPGCGCACPRKWYPGFDFHPLRGLKPTRYSVHVNGPWCITFEFDDGEACQVDFEQYH